MTNTIIFDMDGVLFDTERIACECWEEIGYEMKLGDLSQGVRGCIGLNHNDAASFMLRLYGDEFPFEEFHDTVKALMKQRIMDDGLPLKEGVIEILDYLTKKQYIIGLATSTNKKTVLDHLKKTDLTHYFRTIITGDMVEHSKPLPDIYLKACEELGVSPSHAIAIEDSPNGIRSAYRAGMKVIMVPDMIEPTPEIKAMLYGKFYSLIDVIDYLEKE